MYQVFGPGVVILTRTDIANGTPLNAGYANEFSFEESATSKELYGQFRYPLDVGVGGVKVTGKLKNAVLSPGALNLFNGNTFTAGGEEVILSEAHSISTGTTTAIVSNSSSLTLDLGVFNASTGIPYTKVASSPAAGQYSEGAGTYTFSTPGSTTALALSYAYSQSTVGQVAVTANQNVGINPTFQMDYWTTRNGNPYYIRFYKGQVIKRSMQFKFEDFMMPELDLVFSVNAANQMYQEFYAQLG